MDERVRFVGVCWMERKWPRCVASSPSRAKPVTRSLIATKAQLLLNRLQLQQAAVARFAERLSDARGRLADTQNHQRELAAHLKRNEEALDNTEISPADRKEIQKENSIVKGELENLAPEEQQRQTAEMEAEEQLRTQQAKLDELESRVDRLEKELENPH